MQDATNLRSRMYIDDIKIFAKIKKRTENPDINNKNLQPGYRNGI